MVTKQLAPMRKANRRTSHKHTHTEGRNSSIRHPEMLHRDSNTATREGSFKARITSPTTIIVKLSETTTDLQSEEGGKAQNILLM